jgi:hypothetical protein
MKKITLIFACCCFYSTTFSQEQKSGKLAKDRTPNIKLSFLSRITTEYPGFVVGAEFMMQRKSVQTKRFLKTKEKFLTANFSILDEPDIYDNASFYLEWLKRTRYNEGGFFTEAAVGLGLGKAINYQSPPTYVRNADGTESVKNPRNVFSTANFTVGLGYDFMPKKAQPFKVFVKAGLYPILLNRWAWPYSLFIKTEVGVVTSLSVFKKK